MKNLEFLIAAYSVVWLIIGFYVLVLMMRNRRLQREVERLESRIVELENKAETSR